MISLIPKSKDSSAEVVLYVAKKVPVIAEKTFFQKYSTFILLGGFFIFNMFIQKKTRQMSLQHSRPPTRPAQGGNGNSGNGGKSAVIEEVTDTTADNTTTASSGGGKKKSKKME